MQLHISKWKTIAQKIGIARNEVEFLKSVFEKTK
jgi:hypothetical protein